MVRYRHFSVLGGRRVISVLILLFFLLVALQACGGKFWQKQQLVKPNVLLNGNNLGGLTIEETRGVLNSLATELRVEPVNAVIDPVTKGVIPEFSGVELDLEATLSLVMQAKAGSKIEPAFIDLPAEVGLASFPRHPVYQGNSQKPQVAFLINVAWGNEYLQEILEVLQAAEAGATFFLVGRWVRENQEMARLLRDSGFELANHGYSDLLSMSKLDYPQALQDIKEANDVIEEICGVRPIFFSPHKGELSEHVLKAAAQENNRTVLWTVDTVDWKLPGVEVMSEKIYTNAAGGSLILMHPTAQTAELLRKVIPALRATGLEPVSLSELLCPSRTRLGVRIP
ncbi:MAG: polysaccharide deacetylase family protein [Dethiobacter sp.]|jgi:probable sporulation protein (polysaccharide deacetylase family)|nr:polysaccharide deacetylase family protein [Dethiobacter sp.]MCL4462844.1 polysaccharide deacetylase family protein [Bacillota bacterium]MCL5993601.1 polysaccharide deacetylase family protein [Bacillota bacterium]